MASFHSRSNSFPSQSHPAINDVEDHLERLKASQATSTSSSICAYLASLRDLNDGINNMIQMPSIQQALAHEQGQHWINELLEGSLTLVDLCGFSKDIVQLTKESVQDLESSIRRKSQDIDAYVASRKKITKMINKCVKNNLKSSSNQDSSPLPTIGRILKEAESLNLSILKSVLILFNTKETKKIWSLLSKFTQSTKGVHSDQSECDEDLCSLNIHKSQKSKCVLSLSRSNAGQLLEIPAGGWRRRQPIGAAVVAGFGRRLRVVGGGSVSIPFSFDLPPKLDFTPNNLISPLDALVSKRNRK